MDEISRSSIYRAKIKKEAEKRKLEEEPKVHIGVVRNKRKYTFSDAVDMVQKNKVAGIFESPEEEKMFSEIAKKIKFEKAENETIER